MEDICKIDKKNNYRYISCSQSKLRNSFSFIINNITLDFFTNIFIDSFYGIISYYCDSIHNFTGIGPQLLSQFNYTLFDYENKQVKFYRDRTIFSLSNTILYLLYIEYFILLFNTVVIPYIKNKSK